MRYQEGRKCEWCAIVIGSLIDYFFVVEQFESGVGENQSFMVG